MKLSKDQIERVYYTRQYTLDTPREVILEELSQSLDESLDILVEPKVARDGNVLYGYCSVVVDDNLSRSNQ